MEKRNSSILLRLGTYFGRRKIPLQNLRIRPCISKDELGTNRRNRRKDCRHVEGHGGRLGSKRPHFALLDVPGKRECGEKGGAPPPPQARSGSTSYFRSSFLVRLRFDAIDREVIK
jgi:hypothetical protein